MITMTSKLFAVKDYTINVKVTPLSRSLPGWHMLFTVITLPLMYRRHCLILSKSQPFLSSLTVRIPWQLRHKHLLPGSVALGQTLSFTSALPSLRVYSSNSHRNVVGSTTQMPLHRAGWVDLTQAQSHQGPSYAARVQVSCVRAAISVAISVSVEFMPRNLTTVVQSAVCLKGKLLKIPTW